MTSIAITLTSIFYVTKHNLINKIRPRKAGAAADICVYS